GQAFLHSVTQTFLWNWAAEHLLLAIALVLGSIALPLLVLWAGHQARADQQRERLAIRARERGKDLSRAYLAYLEDAMSRVGTLPPLLEAIRQGTAPS